MRVVAVCLLALFAQTAHARWWFFSRNPQYYDPLIAGIRDAQVSALFPAFYDRMPMMVSRDGTRFGWDIDLGAELPIFGRDPVDSTFMNGRPPAGRWSWGFWIPVDFHMIEDFRDTSAPIVNTDYRFSGMVKVIRGLPNDRWISGRVQYGHESTHLGDEFSLHAEHAFPTTFERINVSWQYLDIGAAYDWPIRGSRWSVRGGVTSTFPFRQSYYSVDLNSITISRIGPVTPSKNWYDPYAGAEVRRDHALFRQTWDVYASAELRWRSVYDYHKASANQSEERQPSVNLIAGIVKNGAANMIGRPSPFVRFYHGVNPHGQFRNQKNYTEAGIGIRLVR